MRVSYASLLLLSISSLSAALPTATSATEGKVAAPGLLARSGAPWWNPPTQKNPEPSCSCQNPSTSSSSSVPTPTGSSVAQWLPYFEQSHCSLNNVQQPAASMPLPAPAASLIHVALGRGTQNYSCDAANPSAAPVQVGALATLYNATCLAATNPQLMSAMPAVMLNFPFSYDQQSPVPGGDALISGHHFFTGPTNPTFGMDTANWQLGISSMSKSGASPALATAQNIQNVETPSMKKATANGNVAWLYLTVNKSFPADEQAFSEVYRVNTIGGQPPATCEGQPATFEVDYAAEYWFYAS